jgi:hypothetical protein
MLPSTHAVSLTCTHCHARSIVNDGAAYMALFNWKCAHCGAEKFPVLAIKPAANGYIN